MKGFYWKKGGGKRKFPTRSGLFQAKSPSLRKSKGSLSALPHLPLRDRVSVTDYLIGADQKIPDGLV